MKTIRIGVPQSGYPIERNIPQIPGFRQIRPWEYHRLRTAFSFRFKGKLDQFHQFSFSAPYFPSVDFLHFFNSISSSKTPWFTTYESIIPRWWNERSKEELHIGVDRLIGNPCRGLIAFSNATERVVQHFFETNGLQSEWHSLAAKRHVLLPPQPVFPERPREDNVVRFCFIGNDFYRKGGAEVVGAFYKLFETGKKNWRLTIVGDLRSWGDYASATTEADEFRTRFNLSQMSSLVTHHTKLPHPNVLSILQESHYLLIPTFHDTFGYVVLEAMAAGCVPITTKTRVFPEIICHGMNGFMLDVPTNQVGDVLRSATSPEEKQKLTHELLNLLELIVEQELKKWSELSAACRMHIQSHHNPIRFQDKLEFIYRSGLGI
jgi:glycosyltransferase involved in cell wall biosynthesis